jgi:hypothetical protein
MKQTSKSFQMGLELDPGILDEYPDFRDVVRASVYSCGRAFKAIAADLDMSVSELSRKLSDNPNDPIHFPYHRLPDLIRATGDVRPIYWLIATFIESDETKQKRAIDQLSRLLPQIQVALKAVKG